MTDELAEARANREIADRIRAAYAGEYPSIALDDVIDKLFQRLFDPVRQAEDAIRLAEHTAARTDPWCWYCRRCGAKGAEDDEQSRDTAAFAHVDTCPLGRGVRVGTDAAGRLRHVWSFTLPYDMPPGDSDD